MRVQRDFGCGNCFAIWLLAAFVLWFTCWYCVRFGLFCSAQWLWFFFWPHRYASSGTKISTQRTLLTITPFISIQFGRSDTCSVNGIFISNTILNWMFSCCDQYEKQELWSIAGINFNQCETDGERSRSQRRYNVRFPMAFALRILNGI